MCNYILWRFLLSRVFFVVFEFLFLTFLHFRHFDFNRNGTSCTWTVSSEQRKGWMELYSFIDLTHFYDFWFCFDSAVSLIRLVFSDRRVRTCWFFGCFIRVHDSNKYRKMIHSFIVVYLKARIRWQSTQNMASPSHAVF